MLLFLVLFLTFRLFFWLISIGCILQCTDYLAALLSSERLIQEGGCIHYFQSNAYYIALLGLPTHMAVCLQPDMSAADYKKQLRQDRGSSSKAKALKLPAPSGPASSAGSCQAPSGDRTAASIRRPFHFAGSGWMMLDATIQ